ncbi:acyl carrier protein, partial [Francisella tularensis subsp. holarctica]|nr:acyl carrier protein [Francisella tularensis subsp. holarctica]
MSRLRVLIFQNKNIKEKNMSTHNEDSKKYNADEKAKIFYRV